MDETMNTGFPIPPSRPMFGEMDVDIEKKPLPESDFIMSFANDAGDKAVVLTSVEVVDGDLLEKHGREELEGYAMDILDGGDDELGLQIGEIYEGETAADDAKAEAFRLDEEYNPGEDATDEELVTAVSDIRSDKGSVIDIDEEEDFDFPALKEDEEDEEPEEEFEEEEITEEEPMLGQLKKVKK